MSYKKIVNLGLLSCMLVFCFHITDLNAWARKPVDYNKCDADGISSMRCEKQAEEDNQHVFETLLSTNAFTIYNDFLPEQKTQAMDFADNNRMSPDAAVARVRANQ